MCRRVEARKGVIVSAGAILTPQLLQVSGVGPRWLSDKLRVRGVVDLPVGNNFTDRLVLPVGYVSPEDIPLTVGYTILADPSRSVVIEGVGGGDVTSELAAASIALVPPKKRGAYLRGLLSGVFKMLPKGLLRKINRMMQPVALQTDTHSRGSVYAKFKDINRKPAVTANYFADPRDWQSQQERFDRIHALGNTAAIARYSTAEKKEWEPLRIAVETLAPVFLPCLRCFFRTEQNADEKIALPCLPDPVDSKEARDKYLQDYIVSSYHYFGTAAAGSVVDGTDFSVKGTTGLYVADASVIPVPTTINPQGTVMALGHYLGSLLGDGEAGKRQRK